MGGLVPNVDAGAKGLMGAGRLVAYGAAGGSLIIILGRHKLVCSYMGALLGWGEGLCICSLGVTPRPLGDSCLQDSGGWRL